MSSLSKGNQKVEKEQWSSNDIELFKQLGEAQRLVNLALAMYPTVLGSYHDHEVAAGLNLFFWEVERAIVDGRITGDLGPNQYWARVDGRQVAPQI